MGRTPVPSDSPGSGPRAASGRRAALAFLCASLALAATSLPAASEPAASEPAPRATVPRAPLLERDPAGFGIETLERLQDLVARLPETAREQSRTLGATGATLLAILVLALGYGFLGQPRLAARFEGPLRSLRESALPGARSWGVAAAHVLAAGLPPLALWAAHAVALDVTGIAHPAFVLAGKLLLVWAAFGAAAVAARELFVRPLLPIAPEHGRYLRGIAVAILLYAILLAAFLDSLAALGAAPDVVALLDAVFRLSLILFLAIAFSRKRAVMAVFPDLDNPFYRRFVRFLDRVYYLAFGLTVATALLSLAGYHTLANFVWIRTWALAGVVFATVVVIHLLRRAIHRWVFREGTDPEKARDFYRSAGLVIDYTGIVVATLLALDLAGLREILAEWLSVPIYTAGERPVTLLLFVVAAVIVVAFFLLARLLRDYLDFQIYPSLSLDEGVAHAISTFVFYALIVVGILAAIEAIGLGIGSLTVFAGALGVGLGFGLQNIANNLASGLTLIFSRALRRGDWVTVGDTVGVIQEVGIRATRLRTRDAVEYLVPNSEFVSGTIVNWTRTSPDVRLHVPLGVSYGEDPERIREILLTVARESPQVLKIPPPDVWFIGFGDSSLDFELLVWSNLKQASERQVRSDLYFRIFAAFREANVEIPFPQRDVHIRDVRDPIRWKQES